MTYLYGYGQPAAPAAPPAPRAPAPAPARPRAVFRFNCPAGCAPLAPDQCQAEVSRAANAAIQLALDAADKLEAVPPTDRTRRTFRGLFGHDPSRPVPWANNRESGLIVAHRLRKVADAFVRRVVHINCSVAGTGNAFITPGVPNVINIRPPFWTLAGTGATTETDRRFLRAGILFHEMLHLLYGPFMYHGDPATGDPREHRRDNSHCYEALVLQLAGRRVDPTDLAVCAARPF